MVTPSYWWVAPMPQRVRPPRQPSAPPKLEALTSQGVTIVDAHRRGSSALGLPRWVRQVPYACVLSGVTLGLIVVATGHYRKGSLLVGGAVLFGALVRLVLPAGQVGLLATRKRAIDVLILAGLAVAITSVAYTIHI